MALTGERLHQLLHASALRRKQKRRSNRHTSVTTGEEEEEDEEEAQLEGDRDRKSLENGQYLGCYVVASRGRLGKEKWMKPFSGQRESHTTATPDPSQSTTYTASVTEDLAFRKLRLEELPSSVRRPRSASLSIYVLDEDLTQWIVRKASRELSRKASKLPEDSLVPRRKRSTRDDTYYGLDYHDVPGSVPPVPPKPGNLSAQPPSLIYTRSRDARENNGHSTDDERPPEPAPNRSPRPLPTTPQEPALPLPPRKNRPLPSVGSTRLNGYLGTVSDVTRPHERLKDSRAISDPASHEDDDYADHYEALDSKVEIPEANTTTEAKVHQGPASSSGKGSPDTASIDERHESDSVFDKSNDVSYTGSSSDLDTSRPAPPYDEVSNQDDDAEPPKTPAPRVPLSPLPPRPEIALPKMSRDRFDDSDSSGTDTYEPIEVRDDPFETDGSPSRYGGVDTPDEGPGDSSWLLIRRDDIVIVETAAVYNAPLAISETESDDGDVEQLVHSDKSPERPQSDSVVGFLGTSLCYDKDGNAIYVPTDRLKPYGDPRGQPWFYPLELSSREATLFLRGEQQEGCFLVYRSSSNYGGASTAAYNLSVSRGNGDVLHYHILEGPEGGVTVEGHDHSFLNLADLVDFFRRNKSTIATRLRRPLKEARLPITAGYHYDLNYELDRNRLSLTGSIIGKGNFGIVCSGTYGTAQVAVKVLQGSETSLEEEDDFIEEARVLMLLKHEHIVKIIGVSSSARPFFLVTEFIRNGNLKECLRAGRIPTNNPEIVVSICLQMLAALSYLETVKVILHRDVAARNFLVADLKCIKLADFGRARYVSDDNYQAPRTEKISIKWAAPEVLVDFRYSTKSDIWAAGVAMWEVYSVGERPYESLSAEQTAVYVTEGGRLARPALCPEEMYSAVRRCWRRSPAPRPSAADLHQTIQENRRAAIYRRNQKSNSVGGTPTITVSVAPRPSIIPPTTPVMSKKALKNGGTRSGKQRFSSLRDALTYVSSKDGDHSMKKTNSNERLPHSSSSDNVSLPSTPDPTASQRIRSSFRKLIITKKIRNNSKSKADYLQTNGKPCTITEL